MKVLILILAFVNHRLDTQGSPNQEKAELGRQRQEQSSTAQGGLTVLQDYTVTHTTGCQ